jgi:hypothetical protein
MFGVTALGELAIAAERDVVFSVTVTSELTLALQPPIVAMLSDPRLDIIFAVEIYPGIATDRVGVA